jgi:hypothetical protein
VTLPQFTLPSHINVPSLPAQFSQAVGQTGVPLMSHGLASDQAMQQ